jgi:hypothetical protein
MTIQFILLVTLAVITILTWRRAMQHSLRLIEAVAWTLVWIAAAVIISLPGLTTIFAEVVGIGRGVDLVVYLSIFLLFILVFHLHVMHDRMERSLTELVRQDALRQIPSFERSSSVSLDRSS